MRKLQTNAELEAIHMARQGLVFNDFTSGPTAGQYNVLHAADCTWVRRMLQGVRPEGRPSVRKIYFDSVDEAQLWLAVHRGGEGRGWKSCRACRPAHVVEVGGLPQAVPQPGEPVAAGGHAVSVFREREVERLLYARLRQDGYSVQEQVPVASGIVDAVATRNGERLVIEAKGEDAGGYSSAQMNFQMAFGQLASRMTDPSATYAIAFPMTADYVRVLRTFRGSLAFERLNLVLYLVARDGTVRRIDASQFPAWLQSSATP